MKPGQIKHKHTQLAGLMNQLIRMLFVKNTVVPKAVLFLIHISERAKHGSNKHCQRKNSILLYIYYVTGKKSSAKERSPYDSYNLIPHDFKLLLHYGKVHHPSKDRAAMTELPGY